MRIKVLLCCAGLLSLHAQFSQLATSHDGNQLYFISAYRLRGQHQQSPAPKLFRYDSLTGFFEMLRQGQRIGAPEISADNSLLVYTDVRTEPKYTCFANPIGGPPICQDLPGPVPYSILERGSPQALPGIVRTSPDGRFAIHQTETRMGAASTLLDLSAGTRRELTGAAARATLPVSTRRVVSNRGSVLLQASNSLFLWDHAGGSRTLARSYEFGACTLDDNASVVIYEVYPGPGVRPTRLKAWFSDSDRTLDLASSLDGDIFNPSISFDGGLVAFLHRSSRADPPQAWLVHADDSSLRRLTEAEEGIADCVLSPNGTVLWAVTRMGRILRVDTWTALVEEVNPPTPFLADGFGAPGSAVSIYATGLNPARHDYRLYIWGRLVPLLDLSENSVAFQLPWEFSDLAEVEAEAELQPDHPVFQQPYPKVRIRAFAPEFKRNDPGGECGPVPAAQAFHSDGKPVTHLRPASPGETVSFAITGLGPVDPPIASGTPSPEPPPVVASPFRCSATGFFTPGDRPPLDSRATLWPGRIGLYRLDATLPNEMPLSPAGCAQITCSLGASAYFISDAAFPFRNP